MARQTPPTPEIIAAIKASHRSSSSNALQFDSIRQIVQDGFGTNSTYARKWLRIALADPEQNDYVWLNSHDSKVVYRIVRREPDDPYTFKTTGLTPGDDLGKLPNLYVNSSGGYVTDAGIATRNQEWVVSRSTLDDWIRLLTERHAAERAESDRENYARAAETERLMGRSLGLVRGMLAEAGIELDGANGASMRARAREVQRGDEEKPIRHGFLTIDLHNADIARLRKWLESKGVESVPPPPGAPGAPN